MNFTESKVVCLLYANRQKQGRIMILYVVAQIIAMTVPCQGQVENYFTKSFKNNHNFIYFLY